MSKSKSLHSVNISHSGGGKEKRLKLELDDFCIKGLKHLEIKTTTQEDHFPLVVITIIPGEIHEIMAKKEMTPIEAIDALKEKCL